MSLQSLELEWEDSNSGFVQLLVSLSSCCCGLGHIFPSRHTGEAPQPIAAGAARLCGSKGSNKQGHCGDRRSKKGSGEEMQLLSASRHQVRTHPGGTTCFLASKLGLSSGCCCPPCLFQDLPDAAEGRKSEVGLYSHEMPQSSNFHSFCP